MITVQPLQAKLSDRVHTASITDTSERFQEANHLVLRGFQQYTANGQPLDASLKSLGKPSKNYLVIASTRSFSDQSDGKATSEIFSVMSVSKGDQYGGTYLPAVGIIMFSKKNDGQTQYLHEMLHIQPDEVTEIGNFVCIDKVNKSLVRTSEGFEAFFNSLRIASIWSYQNGAKVSIAIMKPSLHRLVARTISIPYDLTTLQPNFEAKLPSGKTVREFFDHIPGYWMREQPVLYYIDTQKFYKHMNSSSTLLRARLVSRSLQWRRLVRE